MFDVITFGSATVDVFVGSDTAQIIDVKSIDGEKSFYALDYGAKLEIDHSSFDVGGGAINTAACFSKLGLNTAASVKIGMGVNSKFVEDKLKEYNISKDFLIYTDEERTGFSIILTSFEGDRTVLAHRGANITLKKTDINFEKLNDTKWIYCAPLNSKHGNMLEFISEYAAQNNIKLAHNLGGQLLDKKIDEISHILNKINILTLNAEEALRITKTQVKNANNSKSLISNKMKDMLLILKSFVKDVVIITDGKKGAYACDGANFYYAPIFPTKRKSSLGAGDAFASTFCASFMLFGPNIIKALELASINSGSVVSYFNAQDGLLSVEELLKIKDENPDFKAYTVEK